MVLHFVYQYDARFIVGKERIFPSHAKHQFGYDGKQCRIAVRELAEGKLPNNEENFSLLNPPVANRPFLRIEIDTYLDNR